MVADEYSPATTSQVRRRFVYNWSEVWVSAYW